MVWVTSCETFPVGGRCLDRLCHSALRHFASDDTTGHRVLIAIAGGRATIAEPSGQIVGVESCERFYRLSASSASMPMTLRDLVSQTFRQSALGRAKTPTKDSRSSAKHDRFKVRIVAGADVPVLVEPQPMPCLAAWLATPPPSRQNRCERLMAARLDN